MGNGRILHLATNEKFIDHAYISFENVAPGKNDFYVFMADDGDYIKLTPHTEVRYRNRLGAKLGSDIGQYDFVVVHSMHPFWISVINSVKKKIIYVWVGWGYDYYDIIYPDKNQLLLESTRRDKETYGSSVAPTKSKFHLLTFIRSAIERLVLDPDKTAAIQKMTYFSPVLPNEYALVRRTFQGNSFPQEIQWNYGSLEEVLLKGFLGKTITGRNVLVGNSASNTSNHMDILGWLSKQRPTMEGRKTICPLSYGDQAYAQRVREFGESAMGESFDPLIDFVSLSDYLNIVSSCSHLLMNHARQQGVGNIIIMLYLGAMVFLREENPAYHYFKGLGFHISTVQELQSNPGLLNSSLDSTQRQRNIDLLFAIWSKNAIDRKTSQLMEAAMSSTTPA